MAKKITGYINLIIGAGGAKPAPPVGPALGQKGVNIMGFCKEFNAATSSLEAGAPIPVKITVYADKSFTFETKKPTMTYYLKKYAKLQKGSGATKKVDAVAKITMDQCREIAKEKMEDLNSNDIEAAAKIVKGSAESMGIEVI